MNDNLNMDKTIREKLDGHSVAPPSHVWDNIQGHMAAKRRKKRLIYIGWISAAAVVVFAFLAGWYLNQQTGPIVPEMVEQQIMKANEEETVTSLQDNIAELEKKDAFVAEKSAPQLVNSQAKTKAENSVYSSAEELKIENSLVAVVERISYDFLESLEAVFTHNQTDVYLAKHSDFQRTEEVKFTTYDEILIAQNLKNIGKKSTNEKGWIVGAYLSPGYSSHSANHNETYAKNMTYAVGDGNKNVGGGMSVQYKTSKRLRVESGVYYAQNGQSSNNSLRGLFNFNSESYDELVYSPASENSADTRTGFANVVQLSNNGIEMNSTAGVINMRSTPEGASIATVAESSNADYANTLNTNGEFSQVFEFVEIPLYLRYSLLDKKFGIELMGGLNAGLVVGNNAYIDNDSGKQNIGSTEDISTLNFSGTVGIGVNYMLGKHLSLAVEPRLNYYLSSINSNPDVDFRPYRIGVFTGVYYEF